MYERKYSRRTALQVWNEKIKAAAEGDENKAHCTKERKTQLQKNTRNMIINKTARLRPRPLPHGRRSTYWGRGGPTDRHD
jgi:dihydroxyacetone kinase